MISVAVGVLRRADGTVLINQRPRGKIAAGRWEFPGGKREPDESAEQALRRELHEELGIVVRQARPLIRLEHQYADRRVELDTWLVTDWQGEPSGCEQQAIAWVAPQDLGEYDLLEADAPIVHALQLPTQLPITADLSDAAALCTGMLELARAGHRLIRLRAPALTDAAYQRLVAVAGPQLVALGSGLLVDRNACELQAPGVAGRHLRGEDFAGFSAHSQPQGRWLFAACHDLAQARVALALGAQALVLGSVAPSATHPEDAALGWSGFAAIGRQVNCPVYAIGGLGVADLPACYRAGGQGVAAIRAYWPVRG